jgi:cbb3-type cytochrome oxidase maturation protein
LTSIMKAWEKAELSCTLNTTIPMKVIFLLILVSLVVALGFLAAFIWAVRSGQYDDDYTPSVRMLLDDEPTTNDKTAN